MSPILFISVSLCSLFQIVLPNFFFSREKLSSLLFSSFWCLVLFISAVTHNIPTWQSSAYYFTPTPSQVVVSCPSSDASSSCLCCFLPFPTNLSNTEILCSCLFLSSLSRDWEKWGVHISAYLTKDFCSDTDFENLGKETWRKGVLKSVASLNSQIFNWITSLKQQNTIHRKSEIYSRPCWAWIQVSAFPRWVLRCWFCISDHGNAPIFAYSSVE